ncbi:MAG: hypothetical protein Q7R53_02340 [bacterium]|nr:hypothetical protein [bacterium]
MLIKYLKSSTNRKIKFEEKLDISSPEKYYEFSKKGEKIVLGGKFYYYNQGLKKNIFFRENPYNQLSSLLAKYGLEGFINNVEGEYWGLVINGKANSVRLFSDKLKQLELYYFDNEKIFLASDDPKEIIDEIGRPPAYNKQGLISNVLLHLPKGHTLFQGIYRLKYNETIKIAADKILLEKFKDTNVNIADYSQADLEKYEEMVTKAVLSRASKKMNLVLNSGGWDSTLILALLVKHLGKNKVRSVTMKITFADGRCFNVYEIAKVKKIAKMLGIKNEVVEMDYKKENLYSAFESIKDPSFYRGLLFLAPANWGKTIDHIKNRYGKDIVVFHGEGCDSLQNFGLSQFETLFHENEDFRSYADKMANYLFSPSFFSKIKDNSFANDNVYRIFKGLYPDKKFVEVQNLTQKEKIYYYLLSFIMSDIRVPFRKVESKGYIKDVALRNFENWLKEEYFEEAVDNISEKNLYYYYLNLYTSFHLQSPQIHIYRTGIRNMRFPYIDLNTFNFLARMPESFGRGLEFRPTKYAEKTFAKRIFSKELVALLEAGPHSYLYEIENMNPYDEYLLKGSLYEQMKKKIDIEKISKIFDNSTFESEKIMKFAEDFKQGRLKNLSSLEKNILLAIMLFSIHPDA